MPKQQQVEMFKDDAPPAYLEDAMKEDAGKGISTDAADNLVPLAYVLQGLSPQVNESDPAYVPGAKAGDILLRNLEKPIVKGHEGVLFQPCYFNKDWVEWVTRERGGGFVGRHSSCPTDAVQRPDGKFVRDNGNEVRETRYHAGFAYVDGRATPVVIPFASTGHTVSKNWMFNMAQHTDKDGNVFPSFSQKWRLRTRQRQNTKGKWFVFEPSFEGYFSAAEYHRGRALHQAFKTGEKKAAAPEAEIIAEDDGAL